MKREVEFVYDFKAFGQAIKKARRAAGYSRKKLGHELNLAPRYLVSIENEGQHPSLQVLYELCTFFDISVDQFFFPDKVAKSFFIRLPYCPLSNVASFPTAPLPYPATALLSMPIPTQMDISCLPLPIPFLSRNTLHSQDIILTRMPHGGGTATSIPFTLAILCSSSPATILCCMQISRCCSALPAPDDMIQSLSLLLSMSWKNICPVFP